jgi:hypothetical protein
MAAASSSYGSAIDVLPPVMGLSKRDHAAQSGTPLGGCVAFSTEVDVESADPA